MGLGLGEQPGPVVPRCGLLSDSVVWMEIQRHPGSDCLPYLPDLPSTLFVDSRGTGGHQTVV